jgi:hypothetical protein
VSSPKPIPRHSDERREEDGALVEEVSGTAAEKLDAHGGMAARLRYRLANETRPTMTMDETISEPVGVTMLYERAE